MLDAAGVRQALLLSLAYQYGNPNNPPVQDEYARVKEENDWTAQQVSEYPDRLRGFCGVDPLKSYAIAEIGRCAKDVYVHYGLKLHFGNSDVNIDDPRDVAQLRRVFRAADEHGMAIGGLMGTEITGAEHGAMERKAFLQRAIYEEVVHAPHSTCSVCRSGKPWPQSTHGKRLSTP